MLGDGRGERQKRQGWMMTKGWTRTAQRSMPAVLFAAFAMLMSWPAHSDTAAGEKLYKSAGCATCHAIDQKLVGPSYEDVAKKFAGQPDAVATLVAAVKKGHVGTWGVVPMPPHPNLPDSEIKQIVEWILSLKK